MTTESPRHSLSDWQYEVANGDTRLGYDDWLVHQREANAPGTDNGGEPTKLVTVEWTETATYRQTFTVPAGQSIDLEDEDTQERLEEVICEDANWLDVASVDERTIDSAVQAG